MSAIRDWPKEFVERTLLLLDKGYQNARTNQLEVTFLINCMLGLIVATYEQLKESKEGFFEKKLYDEDIIEFIPERIAILDIKPYYDRFKAEVNKKSLISQFGNEIEFESKIDIKKFTLIKNITLREFIRNIRNGISHQNLMATSEDSHWKGIRIWNHNTNGIKDFEVEFSINQLREFAKMIGEKYLENLPPKKIKE